MISREFVLAGRAIFTVSNASGEHYTYRITLGNLRAFAAVLAGPDNTSSYVKLAVIDPESGGLIGEYGTDKRVAVLAWSLRKIWTQSSLPSGYEIRHAGKCGRCGRLLTTPESLASGLGPKCLEKG